ncbi:hypothetical protein [Nocardia neocaledoniensis]|uniref:hypothetical protein n=1 Tax=Nocardia neocaledoniensis TaxID=236511 RepID=UPI0011B5CF2A|nr:hypothetical protein [Nocardia neocaledoniensis]
MATLAIITPGATLAGIGHAAADVGGHCLWSGTTHSTGTEIVAGGMYFTCHSGPSGVPEWRSSSGNGSPTVVPNPGATSNPAGLFSVGAVQPGTEYNDYCVGSQLIDGSEDVYRVVSDAKGFLFWKAAGPISQWRFDPGRSRVPTTQSSGICVYESPS